MAAKASVKIKYSIPVLPTGSYTSAKIAYKKDIAPTSVKDADGSKNIDPAATTTGISKLDVNTKYYFVIYTVDSTGNKMESEDYMFITGDGEEIEEFVMILKNGQLLRPDVLVDENWYIPVSNPTFVSSSANFTNDGLLFSATNTATSSASYCIMHYNIKDGGSTVTFLHTNSQQNNTKTLLKNTLKMKINFSLKLCANGFNENYVNPQISINTNHNSGGGNSYTVYLANCLSDQTYCRDNVIVYPTENEITLTDSFEISLRYNDYADIDYPDAYPDIEFYMRVGSSDPSGPYGDTSFEVNLLITEIKVEMNAVILPKETDIFNIKHADNAEKSDWTIEQIFNAVQALQYNSFILYPVTDANNITSYSIVPINIPEVETLYTCRDSYVYASNSYLAFGLSGVSDVTDLQCYYGNADGTKSLNPTSYGTMSLSYESTLDGHLFKWTRILANTKRKSFVFYTESCNNLYVNNVLIKGNYIS